MFYECSSLSDIGPLEKWNVSNGKDFSCMFSWCTSLSDIKPLEKWNILNGINFNHIFYNCSHLLNLLNLKTLDKWKNLNKNFGNISNTHDNKIITFGNPFYDLKKTFNI